ncbi:MAG: PepSY domain-containing protein [Methylococcus sp.]
MKRITLLVGCATLLGGPTAMAATAMIPKSQAGMETCLQASLAKMNGDVIKVEFKQEGKTPIFEIEIEGKDKTMEYECDANTGKITEEEQEVDSIDHALFKAKAKISLEQAKAIALKAHPGDIVEMEFEIESNGNASYEFDILQADGKEVKMEIDAATGAIVEDDEHEIYQIGKE